MTRRIALFSGAVLLVAFVLMLPPHGRHAAARDGRWGQAGAGPRQEATSTPSPSPHPPPVVCPTCPLPPSPHEAMMATDSVFQCTVRDVVNLGADGGWDYRVTCPLERYWTANLYSSDTLYVPWSVWECGLQLHPGENWLIYTNLDDAGRNVIDHCSRTTLYSGEESRQLGSSCEFGRLEVRADRSHVKLRGRFAVTIDFINIMPLPERVYAQPAGLVDVVSAGWSQTGDGQWQCERGNGANGTCGRLSMEARRPGTVRVGASVISEGCACHKGVRSCHSAGFDGQASPVAISSEFEPLYMPAMVSR